MTSDENKLKQLYFIKRILFVVILLYVLMFFFIKASSFSADNADRFIYDLRYAISVSYTHLASIQHHIFAVPLAAER